MSNFESRQFAAVIIGLVLFLCAGLQAQGPARFEVLHSFEGFERKGAFPISGVVRDAMGNLYGTTFWGGAGVDNPQGAGVVFKVDPSGTATILHRFAGGTDGAYPNGLTIDASGNLYGSTLGLGSKSTIFKIDSTGKFIVLYTFVPGNEGNGEPSSVTLDAEGNLYGATQFGGTNGYGFVFKLGVNGQLTKLFSFDIAGGYYPHGGVALDAAGNIYGTTTNGGKQNLGIVYKVDPRGHETVLYSFGMPGRGAYPFGGVTLDAAGNIYGTASVSQDVNSSGLVFNLDPSGKETILYNFTGDATGISPNSTLVFDGAGNLYGTTLYGGTNEAGVVFKLDPLGHETVLYNLPASDQYGPSQDYVSGGVTLDAEGNVYGAAEFGGAAGIGSVFKLTAAGEASTLYSFLNNSVARGTNPSGGVILDAAGNLYGATEFGGDANGPNTCGLVYKLDSTGRETILYTFPSDLTRVNGCDPRGTLAQDGVGNIYGTTYFGGAAPSMVGGNGTVYRIGLDGKITTLYNFQGGKTDGEFPHDLIRDAEGNLYGTAASGTRGGGIIYKVDPSGIETVLYNFANPDLDGAAPQGLIRDDDGNLYGVALSGGIDSLPEYPYGMGLVFRLSPSGQETVLHMFTGGTDGTTPTGFLFRDKSGDLYGTTEFGGAYGYGIVYKLDPAGNEVVLYNFTGAADGGNPMAGVIGDASGNLFGTTQLGGAAGYGVVYRLGVGGAETVLHSFTGADGAYPASGLQADAHGNLLGTTSTGGDKQGGVVFRLHPNPYEH